MIRICPSILNVDRANLVGEIAKITQSSDLLHLDIMDNKFVPNFTFTLLESEKIIKNSLLPVDAHLMVEQPESEIPHYLNFGCASVTFHFEATQSPNQCIELIKSSNKRVGMAIKPRTNFSEISNFFKSTGYVANYDRRAGFWWPGIHVRDDAKSTRGSKIFGSESSFKNLVTGRRRNHS